jgi:hypothetical protein
LSLGSSGIQWGKLEPVDLKYGFQRTRRENALFSQTPVSTTLDPCAVALTGHPKVAKSRNRTQALEGSR